MWISNRDFSLPKLRCRAGDPLPSPWQYAAMVRYLREQFGADCVRHTSEIAPSAAPAAERAAMREKFPPMSESAAAVTAPAAGKKGSKSAP